MHGVRQVARLRAGALHHAGVFAEHVVELADQRLHFLRKAALLGLKFLSPMVTSSVLIIAILLIFKIPYSNYKKGADILTFFVAPATVVLAIPLYKNLEIIKKYFLPILLGCLVGIGIGSITGIVLCNIFGINKEILLSMLPKSVTSAIGYEISKKIGAIMEISMVFIVICGIIGYSVGELIFKIFKIDNKVARGVALGSCSHVLRPRRGRRAPARPRSGAPAGRA